jgi:hypothetical protein
VAREPDVRQAFEWQGAGIRAGEFSFSLTAPGSPCVRDGQSSPADPDFLVIQRLQVKPWNVGPIRLGFRRPHAIPSTETPEAFFEVL